MDCCICSPMASVYRPPRNTICYSCYEGAKGMVSFLNEMDKHQEIDTSIKSDATNPSKGLANAWKRMTEMKETEEGMEEKIGFLDGLVVALRDEIHTDILIKPGHGLPIPAHKALLATRSKIFKIMLTSDECKAPVEDTISLPELSHEELRCLLEFLYCGTLAVDDIEKHKYSLLIAADKYAIPFLMRFCEEKILEALGPSNALQVLEVSEMCSNGVLKEKAMEAIVKNMQQVVFAHEYYAFASKNPHLCVQITRQILMDMKSQKEKGASHASLAC